jgi:N-acetylmuramoyl-L-alanine amidase
MKGYRTHPVRFAAVALMALAPFCGSNAADVKAARVWAGPEYTRVVLDVSGPVTYKVTQDGDQLTVDVNDSSISTDFSSPSAQGLYKGLSGARQGNDVRLTAKVAPSSNVKSFLLKPQADYGYRLVLDLYPGSGVVSSKSSAPDTDDSSAAPVVASATLPVPAPAPASRSSASNRPRAAWPPRVRPPRCSMASARW